MVIADVSGGICLSCADFICDFLIGLKLIGCCFYCVCMLTTCCVLGFLEGLIFIRIGCAFLGYVTRIAFLLWLYMYAFRRYWAGHNLWDSFGSDWSAKSQTRNFSGYCD